MEFPIYFSQSLILISKCFANQKMFNNNNQASKSHSIYKNYVLHPYQFSCWYFLSYKMILQNRLYHIIFCCRKMTRKMCSNLLHRVHTLI